eukprot:TRINITY_DN7734_c0_g2_i2.p1 TRINITY_DN7734_c0_g2~~TRINITY_DN7734_c0_g2_i2.p1  ORF type:complete len:132 (+),score=18.14 TRINITY_DN7734_c0_g2_i2:180-575(+)
MKSIQQNDCYVNIQDVVTRLLPFHIFNSTEGDEADFEECEEEGGVVLTSRSEVWNRMVLDRVADYCRKIDKLQTQIQFQDNQLKDMSQISKNEEYLVERLLCENSKNQVAYLRQETAQLQQQLKILEQQRN